MKKKIASFILRVLLLVFFYFLAYEFWLDRSVADTIHVIVTSILAVIIVRAWEFFKKRRAISNKTKKEEEG
ncbi:hypothetical protein JTF06_02765 [Desemzia sp. RIT804]|uniref:hypothetical protein n=1 Tax=Desemzia sp. RIT 804 TaxID=2810209 RepID=UPI00194FBDF1|nr:hypothetical protein [Desemzia sp. RIT 804]MBM6613815.1 hypothetical protein [Desemzia sp. RIT 804]